MCGISGIIHFDNQPVKTSSIKTMMKSMKHRGPDDDGIYVKDNIGVGFVRLSILDLSALGHQPMFDKTGRYMIVHNGEVYNYIEIRDELIKKGYNFISNTDTEVILYSFIEWGETCLDRFNGMWVFCIYDLKEKSIFISRDRYGIKPLYYYQNSNQIVFASEIKSILKALNKNFKANEKVIYNYLVFNRTDYDEETFFNEIIKLPAGHCLKIFTSNKSNKYKKPINESYSEIFSNIYLRQWYDIRKSVDESDPFSDPNEYRNCLFSSIDLRLRSDVPVGVSLSGGMDSSSILSRLVDAKLDLNTFSAVYGKNLKGDEKEYILEFRNSVKNMNFVQIDDDSLIIDIEKLLICHSSEPIVDPSIYASFKVFEEAQKKIKVTLNGQGADEQLAGYMYFWGHYYKSLFKKGNLTKLFSEIYYNYKNHNNFRDINYFIYYLLPNFLKDKYRLRNVNFLTQNFNNKIAGNRDIINLIDQSSSLQDSFIRHFNFKLQHLLKWEDTNSMYFSIESRLPFLDYRLVERTLSMDENNILYNGQTKYILRRALKGYVPEKIRKRNDKVGFETPADMWFKKDNYQKIIMGILQSNHFNEMNIINSDQAVKLYKRHLNNKINISRDIWKWINLDYWYTKHFD